MTDIFDFDSYREGRHSSATRNWVDIRRSGQGRHGKASDAEYRAYLREVAKLHGNKFKKDDKS